MARNNGVYLLQSKGANEAVEYRVAHCQHIENIEWLDPISTNSNITYGECYLVYLFGKSKVLTKEEADVEAFNIYRDLINKDPSKLIINDSQFKHYRTTCEFGISIIDMNNEYPNITYEEANQYLSDYYKDKTLENMANKKYK